MEDGGCRRERLIKLCEPLANIGCAHADDRVIVGVVAGIAAEDPGADDPLLERRIVTAQRVFDDVAQQILALLAGPEGLALQNLSEDGLDLGQKRMIFRRFHDSFSDCQIGGHCVEVKAIRPVTYGSLPHLQLC